MGSAEVTFGNDDVDDEVLGRLGVDDVIVGSDDDAVLGGDADDVSVSELKYSAVVPRLAGAALLL